MTPLRQRMIEDMRLRNLSPHTIDAYVLAVKQFAGHFGQSPAQLNGDQVRQYLLHLVQERHASWSRYNIARCALQFVHHFGQGGDGCAAEQRVQHELDQGARGHAACDDVVRAGTPARIGRPGKTPGTSSPSRTTKVPPTRTCGMPSEGW